MRRLWMLFLAYFRLSRRAVCAMSVGRGPRDFHDWPDGIGRHPWHVHRHVCRRCGKYFEI